MASVLAVPAWAGPDGQQVVAGNATFARQGNLTTITAANNTIINYNSFNIAVHETVRFIQPDASSRVLNRIQGAAPTHIDGSLLANGIVYIVNPAGVIFGHGAVIDVGGLHAAAASITNQDFIKGIDRFTDAQGSVINRGTIVSPEVVLFGRVVENTGSVISPDGVVAFVAGEDLYLGERGGNMYLRLDGAGGAAQAGGVSNAGSIVAPGGKVMVGAGDMFGVAMHASSHVRAGEVRIRGGQGAVTSISGTIDVSSSDPGSTGGVVHVLGDKVGLFDASINASGMGGGGQVRIGGDFHGGAGAGADRLETASRTYVSEGTTIKADAIEHGDGGSVVVWSDEITRFSGQISAQGGRRGGNGGSAEVSGKESLLYRGYTDLRAPLGERGTLLLDPKNITIANAGADPIPGDTAFGDASADDRTFSPATIVTALDGADLVLQANNDITISDVVDASANVGDGSLTLQAGRSILVNADVTLRGSFSATANDTDGTLVAAERDAGPAVITMAAGTSIDTSTTGGDITLRVLSGGAADTSAGSITLGTLDAGAGHVLIQHDGPTANQGILRADGVAQIVGSSASLATSGAGGGGFIGSAGEPIRLDVANLEAIAQRGGAFFESASDLTIGGASLGGLTGVSVVSTGVSGELAIDVLGQLTVDEGVSVAGDAALQATDGITINANVSTNTTIAGSSQLNADSDGDNATSANPDALVIANAVTLSSTDSDLGLTLGDLDIQGTGSIDAGTGTLSIAGSNAADTIGLGVGGTDVGISAAELGALTAGDLSIGDSGTTEMLVGSIVDTDLGNVSGVLRLRADEIEFQSTASFPNLDARATDDVRVLGDLASTTGDLTLVGDSDATPDLADNVSIGSGVVLNSAGELSITATEGISLLGAAGTENVFTGDAVTLSDILLAAADVRVQSGGDVTLGAVDLDTGDLVIEVDTGDAGTFGAAVGDVRAGSITVSAGSNDSVSFGGTVDTSGAAGVQVDGGAVTFSDVVTTTGTGGISVTNVGLLTIAEGATIDSDGPVIQDGTGQVSLGADVTTSGDIISFAGLVTLADTASDLVTLVTTNGDPAGANVSFANVLRAAAAGAQSITIDAGTGGNIGFTGNVGTVRLNELRVTNANNVTATGTVAANSIRQVAGQGLTTFSSTVTTTTAAGIDLDGTAFTFNAPLNGTGGGLVRVTNSGLLTIAEGASIVAGGGLTQDGAGAVSLGANITTTGDAVSFVGPVTLLDTTSDAVTIDTTSGVAAGNAISFGSTLNAAAAGAQSIALNAGTGGNVALVGNVGATTRLGELAITNANNVTATGTVAANSIRQVAGQGLTTFNGAVTTTTTTGIDLDGASFTFNAPVNATGGGLLRVTNSGTLTIADGATLFAGGGVTQDGTGAVSLGADITTTGDAVSFVGPVTLADTAADLVLIDTTSASPAGNSVLFSSTVTGTAAGAQSLSINAGTGGNITFTGQVGATRLGVLRFINSANVLASSTVTVASLSQDAGQVLSRFVGQVNTNAIAGVDLNGQAMQFDGGVTSTGGGGFTATNAGLLTISEGSPIIAPGGFTQDGVGALTIGSSITTSGNAVSINGDVTLADTASDLVVVNTTSGAASGANVTIQGTIDGTTAGGQSLAINAGSLGNIVLSSDVGGTTRLNTLSITNANDATLSGTVAANSMRQVAGQGTTTFGQSLSVQGSGGIELDGANFAFNSDVTSSATGANIDIDASGTVDFASGASGQGDALITNASVLTIGGGDFDMAGSLTQDGAGAVALNSAVVTTGMSFAGPVTVSAANTLNGRGGNIAFGSTLLASGALTLVTDGSLSFAAAATGTGALLSIEPTTATGAIDIGTLTGGPGAGVTTLSAGSAANINGFSEILFGRASDGNHATRVGTITLNDPVRFNSTGLGSTLVQDGGLTTTGASAVVFAGPTTFSAGVITAGSDVTVLQGATVGQGASVSISTGAGLGNISFDGSINGTAGGGSESLTLSAGTGQIDIDGDVSGLAGGISDAAGLVNLSFGSAAMVTVERIAITGQLRTLSTLTGPFTSGADAGAPNGSVTSGSVDMSGTDFTFNGPVTTSGAFRIVNSGLLVLTGGLTTGGAIEIGGAATLGGLLNSTNNTISLGGATTLVADTELRAGTSSITLGGSSSIATDGHDLSLTADSMALGGASGSISTGSGGALILQPGSAARGIALAGPTVAPSGGALDLTSAEIATIADGFDSVTFGRSDGLHEVRVGTLAMTDPTIVRTPAGGSIFVGDGGIAASDNASISLLGSGSTTTLEADITTDGQDITIDDRVLIGADVMLSTGAGAGDILVTGRIDQVGTTAAGSFGLNAESGTGSVELRGAVGQDTALASLGVTGNSIDVQDIGDDEEGAVGTASLVATNAVTLSGTNYRAGDLAIQGASILVPNAGTAIASTSGAIVATGAMILGDGADLDANASTDARFNGTIDGTPGGASESLNVVAGGVAEFAGDVGSSSAIHAVNVFADQIELGNVTTTTTQSYIGLSEIALSGDLTSVGNGSIELDGPSTLRAPVTVQTAGSSGDNILFRDSVNGAAALTLAAGSGDISFQGAIGALTALDSLTAAAANIALEAIGAAGSGVSGATSIVGSTSVTFNGLVYNANAQSYAAPTKTIAGGDTAFISSGDAITFSGGTLLLGSGNDLSVESSGGNLSFDTILGTAAEGIAIDSGTGTISLAVVGGVATPIGGITLTGDEIELGGNVRGSTIVLQPSTPGLGIEISTGGSTAALDLTAAELGRLVDGFSLITIGRTDNGAHAINVGNATFRDPVRISSQGGGSISLNGTLSGLNDASFLIEGAGATTLSGAISTAGGAVTIDDALLIGAASSINTQGGDVVLAGTVNGANPLSVDSGTGAVQIQGFVGGVTPLASLSVLGDSISTLGATTSGFQRYEGDMTLVAATNTVFTTGGADGADITLIGDILGTGDLTLNSGAAGNISALHARIGPATPIGALTITSAGDASFGQLFATSISQLAGTGLTSFALAPTSTGPAGIQLIGNSFRIDSGMDARGAGDIRITNSGTLSILATERPPVPILFGGDFIQDGSGPSFLELGFGSSTSGQISFAGPVTLSGVLGPIGFTGSSIAFAGPINGAVAGATSLVLGLNTSGGTISLGDVGQTSALRSLSTSGPGSTVLNGDISVSGVSGGTAIFFENAVQVAGDSRVAANDGKITFASRIDGDGLGAHTLAIQVDRSVSDQTLDVIELFDTIGGTEALGSLLLNVEGVRNGVAQIATIASTGGLAINVSDVFEMGAGEKLTAIGDLAINAGSRATLGDLSALGSIEVNAPTIQIRTRDAGVVLGPDLSTLVAGQDQGVDYVAGSTIAFSVVPEVLGDGGVPFFATPDGGGVSGTLSGFSQRAFGNVEARLFTGTSQPLVLDLRAQGPTNTNVSEAIAGAAPRESQSGNVRRGTSIGSAQEEELKQIGIDPRGLSVDTILEAMIGRALYDDLPTVPVYNETQVTEGRLSEASVQAVLQSAREVFGDRENPREEQVREEVMAAVTRYLESTGASSLRDGVAFRAFVENDPASSSALNVLQGLERLFENMNMLGLTPYELDNAWRVIFRRLQFPAQVSPASLRQAVDPTFVARGSTPVDGAPADQPDPEGQINSEPSTEGTELESATAE
jgi:filamentous hemagglutinin family protein